MAPKMIVGKVEFIWPEVKDLTPEEFCKEVLYKLLWLQKELVAEYTLHKNREKG